MTIVTPSHPGCLNPTLAKRALWRPLLSALPLIVGASAACGGSGAKDPTEEPDGGAAMAEESNHDAARTEVDGGTVSAVSPDAMSPASPASDASPAALPTVDAGPDCTPEAGADIPDEDFADSDCDGIDGNAASAVFVAPAGSDGSAGTMSAPVRTIAKAMELAVAGGKAVYVCNGTYEERVAILGDAVSIFGGYDCARDWERIADHAVIAPAEGVPLTVQAVEDTVVLERLAFRANSTAAPAQSSIAAVIRSSASVRLSRVELTAGDAGDGVAAELVPAPTWGEATAGASALSTYGADNCTTYACSTYQPTGACGTVPSGAQGIANFCPDGSQIRGGNGGSGANARFFYGAWLTGPYDGSAGIPESGALNGFGGANAEPGRAGGDFGHIESGRYIADNSGADGSWGAPGQSGTGGIGGQSYCSADGDITFRLILGGGGGQGGYGGCGGPGGKGGGAGGASIALISEDSSVELVWSRVITGSGGGRRRAERRTYRSRRRRRRPRWRGHSRAARQRGWTRRQRRAAAATAVPAVAVHRSASRTSELHRRRTTRRSSWARRVSARSGRRAVEPQTVSEPSFTR